MCSCFVGVLASYFLCRRQALPLFYIVQYKYYAFAQTDNLRGYGLDI